MEKLFESILQFYEVTNRTDFHNSWVIISTYLGFFEKVLEKIGCIVRYRW